MAFDESDLITSKSGANITKDKPPKVILVLGLTDVISTSRQKELLEEGFGVPKNEIKTFPHNAPVDSITTFIKNNPKLPIFLYSAGCVHAKAVSAIPGIDLNKVYIVEPYSPGTAVKSVQTANQNGVPLKNIFLGPSEARGKGILSGTSKTPNGLSHGPALTNAGKEAAKAISSEASTPAPTENNTTSTSTITNPSTPTNTQPSAPSTTTSSEPTNDDFNGSTRTGSYANLSNGYCITVYKDGIKKITLVRDGAGNLIRTDYYTNTTDKDAVSFTLTKLNNATAVTPNQDKPSKVKTTDTTPNNVKIIRVDRTEILEYPEENSTSEYVYQVTLVVEKNGTTILVDGEGRDKDQDTALKKANENARKNAYL